MPKHSTNIAYLSSESTNVNKNKGFRNHTDITFNHIEDGLKTLLPNDIDNNPSLYSRYALINAQRKTWYETLTNENGNPIDLNNFHSFAFFLASLGRYISLDRITGVEFVIHETKNEQNNNNAQNDNNDNNAVPNTSLTDKTFEECPEMFVHQNNQYKLLTLKIDGESFCYWDNEIQFFLPYAQFPFEKFPNNPYIDANNSNFKKITDVDVKKAIKKNALLILNFFSQFPGIPANKNVALDRNQKPGGLRGFDIIRENLIALNNAQPNNNQQNDQPHNNQQNDQPNNNQQNDQPHNNQQNDQPHNNQQNDQPHNNQQNVQVLQKNFFKDTINKYIPYRKIDLTPKIAIIKLSQNTTWLLNENNNASWWIGGKIEKNYFIIPPIKCDTLSKNDNVFAGLTFDLTYEGDKISSIRVSYDATEKTYTGSDIIIIDTAPAILLYPMIPLEKLPNWKKHLCYVSQNADTTLKVTPGYKNNNELVFPSETNIVSKLDEGKKTYKFECFSGEKAFNCFKFSANGNEVGCLGINHTSIYTPQDRNADNVKAALDFGSTNTAFRMKSLTIQEEIPTFTELDLFHRSHFIKVLSHDTNKEAKDNESMFLKTLFCGRGQNDALTKIPSYSQMLFVGERHIDNANPTPMVDGRILEINETLLNDIMVLEAEKGQQLCSSVGIYSDLKLNEYNTAHDPGPIHAAAAVFLYDCLEILLINSISYGVLVPQFIVTYPSDDLTIFTASDNCWEEAINRLNKLINGAEGEIKLPFKVREALAVAAYQISVGQANIGQKQIVVDIGGGTSDIAVFQKSNGRPEVYSTSVRFAGNNILRNSAKALISKYDTPFTKMFEKGALVNVEVYDKTIKNKNVKDASFLIEHCFANGKTKTQGFLPLIVKIKYLALLFYIKKWLENCQALSSTENFFDNANCISFVGGGSLALKNTANFTGKKLTKVVDVPKCDTNMSVLCEAIAEKPEVVEGAFHAANLFGKIENNVIERDEGANENFGDVALPYVYENGAFALKDTIVESKEEANHTTEPNASQSEEEMLLKYIGAIYDELIGFIDDKMKSLEDKHHKNFEETLADIMGVSNCNNACTTIKRLTCNQVRTSMGTSLRKRYTKVDIVGVTISKFAHYFDKQISNEQQTNEQ